MILRLASRKSDLARLQTQMVARALQAKHPHLKIECHFRDSLGDLNQHDPLWQMPEKGVFTSDLSSGLIEGKWDAVVHSWKDLPVEMQPGTAVLATLPRADQRDLLLLPHRVFEELQTQPVERRRLRVLSSSPRREHNLTPFLKDYWPFGLAQVEFKSVRGNVPTRVQKLLRGEGEALILAKAALDRLLHSVEAEFDEAREVLKTALRTCRWMVLPLSESPTAAAQGALAIEGLLSRVDVQSLLAAIHDSVTFNNVQLERRLLAQSGGGCHQKLGFSVTEHRYGQVLSVRGLRPEGRTWREHRLIREQSTSVGDRLDVPILIQPPPVWRRVSVPAELPCTANGIYISHPHACPAHWSSEWLNQKVIWTAGLSTWRTLAQRGIWVNGTDDSLGESLPDVAGLATDSSAPFQWVKLSHSRAPKADHMQSLATYQLEPLPLDPADFRAGTHYFWRSHSQFCRALELAPHLRDANHSCGVGQSAQLIMQTLGHSEVGIFLNEAEWRQHFELR